MGMDDAVQEHHSSFALLNAFVGVVRGMLEGLAPLPVERHENGQRLIPFIT
jgi:hypothetical protein